MDTDTFGSPLRPRQPPRNPPPKPRPRPDVLRRQPVVGPNGRPVVGANIGHHGRPPASKATRSPSSLASGGLRPRQPAPRYPPPEPHRRRTFSVVRQLHKIRTVLRRRSQQLRPPLQAALSRRPPRPPARQRLQVKEIVIDSTKKNGSQKESHRPATQRLLRKFSFYTSIC